MTFYRVFHTLIVLSGRSGRAESTITDSIRMIVIRNTEWQEHTLGELLPSAQRNRNICPELEHDMPFVVRVVVVQLCYPHGFLSARSGSFLHNSLLIQARFSIYFSHRLPVLVGRLLLSYRSLPMRYNPL